jgi:hypothetical protein
MKETPPSLASATASRFAGDGLQLAETIGMFIVIAGVSPRLN